MQKEKIRFYIIKCYNASTGVTLVVRQSENNIDSIVFVGNSYREAEELKIKLSKACHGSVFWIVGYEK